MISAAIPAKNLYSLIKEHLDLIKRIIKEKDDIEIDLIVIHFLFNIKSVFFPKSEPMDVFEYPLAIELFLLITDMNVITFENQLYVLMISNSIIAFFECQFMKKNNLSEE